MRLSERKFIGKVQQESEAMKGEIHNLALGKVRKSCKLGSLGTQTNFTSFPILPANCLEFSLSVRGSRRRKKKELVFWPREGYRSQLWGEGWTGLGVLLALESAPGLCCSGDKRKEGGRDHHPRQGVMVNHDVEFRASGVVSLPRRHRFHCWC